MSRNDPQMKIRLPEELKVRIEVEAKAANRTLNAEIVTRLESTFTSGKMGVGLVAWGGDGPDVMAVGKALESLPVDLVTLYGLRLYREELELVVQQLKDASDPGSDSPSDVTRQLEKEAIHLSRTIFAIHTYRELNGLENLKNEARFSSSIEARFAEAIRSRP